MSGRYITHYSEVETAIDLFDLIDDISDLYKEDAQFKEMIDEVITRSSYDYDIGEALNTLKRIRKNDFLWKSIKPDVEEMLKEDYVVIL